MIFLYTLASAALAYMLGSGNSRRMERRLAELERRLAPEPAVVPSERPVAEPPAETSASSSTQVAPDAGTAGTSACATTEEVTPEIIAVISAAVAAFVGKKARIKRVRRVHSTGMNPWTQQGRVYIQGSHNLASRRGGE